ncbi:MAG: hypothetical protein P8M32_03425, partial [Phycisphaerales bacterium]|nr:hypothetical protein [Phycisphaerales bacterium]
MIRIHVKKTAVHVAKAALTMSATAAGLAMTTRRAWICGVHKIPAIHTSALATTIACAAAPSTATAARRTVRKMIAGPKTRVIR